MSEANHAPHVAVVGAGAVGGYFGGMLARAGTDVVLIGRPAFAEAVRKTGLRIDSVQFQATVHPQASSEISAAANADLVLFCVKATDTASTAKELAKYLAPHAIVVSLQNGVNNVEEIRKASGIEALPSVVYVASAMPEPGLIKHFGRGDLVIGPQNATTEKVAAIFMQASIPCKISDNIEGELWTKLVWNCALNAVSGLGRVTYGEIIASADARRVVELVVEEVLAVAKKRGIHPPGLEDPKVAVDLAYKVGTSMSATRSSTAQDMARGKRTEIDSLNGYIAHQGELLGIPTPVNLTLYTLVKLQEAQFSQQAAKA